MEPDAQFPEDQVGHPTGGPQVGVESVLGGRLGQPAEHLLLLIVGQEPGATGGRLGLQPVAAVGAVPGDPPGDGYGMDAQERGHVLLRPPVGDPLNRQPTPRFQLRRCAFTPHPDRLYNRHRMNSLAYLRISKGTHSPEVASRCRSL